MSLADRLALPAGQAGGLERTAKIALEILGTVVNALGRLQGPFPEQGRNPESGIQRLEAVQRELQVGSGVQEMRLQREPCFILSEATSQ